jgi:predicted cupin superfamily sugar epimerase
MSLDLRDKHLSAAAIQTALGLNPHPEGGVFREIFRDTPADPLARGVATSILFLLREGEASAPHKVDAVELWLWQAGAALKLHIGDTAITLGPDLSAGEVLQGIVPAGVWQAAASTGAWTLVSCVVAPAFHFDGFVLKDPA